LVLCVPLALETAVRITIALGLSRLTDLQKSLLILMAPLGWCKPGQLAQELDIRPGGLGMSLQGLRRYGFVQERWAVRNSKAGREERQYKLTPKGKAAITIILEK
jgi:predicted ArsR family transcriptional regulator